MYHVQHLEDGTVNLAQVARCNDLIDMEAENESRYMEALKRK